MTDPIIVSYSELDCFRQCPLKHFLAYKNRWQKPPRDMGPLDKGKNWHAIMETHYLTIQAFQQALGTPDKPKAIRTKVMQAAALVAAKLAVAPLLHNQDGSQSEMQALMEWMYEGHIAAYGVDPQWIILGVEMAIEIELPSDDGYDSPFRIKAKLDLLVQEVATGLLWIIDHKSGANLPNQFDLEIDDQFGIYTWLMRSIGKPVAGSIHSAARTTRNLADYPTHKDYETKRQTLEGRMHRTYLNRSDAELDNLIKDAYHVAVNAYADQIEGYDSLPLYSSPDPRQCGWRCDFKEVHLLARQGRPLVSALTDYGFQQNFERH